MWELRQGCAGLTSAVGARVPRNGSLTVPMCSRASTGWRSVVGRGATLCHRNGGRVYYRGRRSQASTFALSEVGLLGLDSMVRQA